MTLTASSLPFLYQDFKGGLNTKQSLFQLNDEQARDVLNVQSITTGAIVKRTGLVTFATPANTLDSLFGVTESTNPVMIGSGAGNLYGITTNGTVSTLKTGLTSGRRWEWIESTPVTLSGATQGPVFGMNGTDTPQQWDGVAASTTNWTGTGGSSPLPVPNGTMCISHANRVWVAGVAGRPSRLYWSSLSAGGMDATNWSQTAPDDAGAVDIEPNDGEAITGIGVVGPYLLVGKRHKLYVVYDMNTGANRKISSSVGIASHRSIAHGETSTYFLSNDRGVYATNGSKVQLLSDLITPTLQSIPSAYRNTAAGVFYQGHYYLSYASGAVAGNDKTLDFDSTLNSWWAHSFGSNQFALWYPQGQQQLYSAKSTGFSVTTTAALATTLSAALSTAAAITALPVAAVGNPIASGANVVVSSGANTQTFVASAAVAAGATSIPVNSLVPNFAYPIGSLVAPATTTIPVNAIPVNLASGGQVTVTGGGSSQTFVLSGGVSSGATSLPVNSTVPTAVFASGSTVGFSLVDQCFVPSTYTDNGNAMSWVWRGPWQSPTFYRRRRFPTPYFRKRWRQVRVEGTGVVDFYLSDDFGTTETQIATDLGGYLSGSSVGSDTFGGSGSYGGTGTFGVSSGAPGGVAAAQPPVWKREIYGQGVALAKSFIFSATSTSQDSIFLYSMLLTDRRDLVVS